MKRKYRAEFGINTYNSHIGIYYPYHLDKLKEEKKRYHVYMIALIPQLTIEKSSIKKEAKRIEFDINIETKDGEQKESRSINIGHLENHENISVEVQDSGKSLLISQGSGGIKISVINLYLDYCESPLPVEVVYIGQSFGKNGERKATDRLMSHSTLQKIQSEISYYSYVEELAIVLLEFKPSLVTVIEGGTQYETEETKDKEHVEDVFQHASLKINKEMINITEAALIHFFKPKFNEKFKNNFPSIGHKGYEYYYNYDYNSIIVELNTKRTNIILYSEENVYNPFKLIQYALHPENVRKNLFDLF